MISAPGVDTPWAVKPQKKIPPCNLSSKIPLEGPNLPILQKNVKWVDLTPYFLFLKVFIINYRYILT